MRRAARRLADRVVLTTWRSLVEFVDDRGHRDAAQIAFFGALSFIPLALLLVASFGALLGPAEVRDRIIDTVFDNVPLSEESDRPSLESTLADALRSAGSLGVVSVLLLVAAASGVMSALRHAINQAWDIHERPPLLRRKALDLALIFGATVLLALSLSLTATRRLADLVEGADEGASFAAALLDGVGDLMPYVFTALVILFLYRVLPMRRPRVREIWPGAIVATLLLALVKGALELYFEHLADFGALYGSLGALMALLLFVFAASNVLVFGAEFASEWSRLPPDEQVAATVRRGRERALGRLRRRRTAPDPTPAASDAPATTRAPEARAARSPSPDRRDRA